MPNDLGTSHSGGMQYLHRACATRGQHFHFPMEPQPLDFAVAAYTDQPTTALNAKRIRREQRIGAQLRRHPVSVANLLTDHLGRHKPSEFRILFRTPLNDEIKQRGLTAV